MDIYKRMAEKNKTCRKRQCKRGTVKWRVGGTKYPVVKTTGYMNGQMYRLEKPNEGKMKMIENPLTTTAAPRPRQTQTATPRQTTSIPAAPRQSASPRRPATQRPATIISSSIPIPAAQQTTRRLLEAKPAEPAAQRTTTSTRKAPLSLAPPNLNTKTPNLASIQTSSQQPGKNKPTEKEIVKDFDYREKIFSDIKKYADFRKLEKKKVSFENALTDGAIDMDTTEAKLFNDYIKSRYDYFSYLNKKPSFLKLNRNRSKYYWELSKYEWTLRKLKNKYEELDKKVRVKDILPHFSFIPTEEERDKIYRYNNIIKGLRNFKEKKDYYISNNEIPDDDDDGLI